MTAWRSANSHHRRCRPARLRQLVLYGDAHPAARAARCDLRDLQLLPRGRRRRRRRRRARRASQAARGMARRRECALRRARPPRRLQRARRPDAPLRAAPRGLPRHHRRHGNGRARRHPRARLRDPRPLLRSRRERGRPAVRARVRDGGGAGHRACASPRPRAAAHQHPARSSTRTPAIGRLYLPREALGARRHRDAPIRIEAVASPALDKACAVVVERARTHFREAEAIMRDCPRSTVRTPRVMAIAYESILDSLVARGWSRRPRQSRCASTRCASLWIAACATPIF